MLGVYEIITVLFASAEMMLSIVTKALIVDTLRKQHTILPFQNPNSDSSAMDSHSLGPRHFEQYPHSTTSEGLPSRDTALSPFPLPTLSQPPEDRLIPKSQTSKYISPLRHHQNGHTPSSGNGPAPLIARNGDENSNLTKTPEERNASDNATTKALTSSLSDDSTPTVSSLHIKDLKTRPSEVAGLKPLQRRFALRSQVRKDGDNLEKKASWNERRKEEENGLEKKVSWYLVLDQVCIYVPWTVLGPLSGVWSDRHGRKVLLLLSAVVQVLAVLPYLLVALWPGHLLALILLGGLLRGACGKHAMFVTAMYSVVSDVVPQEEKSARFASLLGWRYVGICSGTLGAGVLLEYFKFSCPLLVVASLQNVCFFLVLVAIRETLNPPERSPNRSHNNLISMMKNFIRRPEINEERIALPVGKASENGSESASPEEERKERGPASRRLGIVLALSFLTQWLWSSQRELSTQVVSFPPFLWPKSWYGYLFAVIFGVASIAAITLVRLGVRLAPWGSRADVNVLVMALLCGVFGCLWTAVAVICHSDWQMFASNALVSVGMSSNSTCRAMASKKTDASGQAMVLAVLSVLENVGKLLGPLVHTAIFVASFSLSPSFVFFIMAAEALLMMSMICALVTGR
ncbi:hypothetical protein ACOMHN_055761 [Nucella lapillus]